jgi:hypothetical protein
VFSKINWNDPPEKSIDYHQDTRTQREKIVRDHCILLLLFFKCICDVWNEEYAKMVAAYDEDFANEHHFQVPGSCSWNTARITYIYVIIEVTETGG